MKAISLWQPWATLVVVGAKVYETRSWSTKPGLLAVHAAKRFDKLQREICRDEPFREALGWAGYSIDTLPLGALVGVVKVLDVRQTGAVLDSLSRKELAFGNYGPGRYAWKLEVVKCFQKPIPMAGMQWLWEVADDLLMRFD